MQDNTQPDYTRFSANQTVEHFPYFQFDANQGDGFGVMIPSDSSDDSPSNHPNPSFWENTVKEEPDLDDPLDLEPSLVAVDNQLPPEVFHQNGYNQASMIYFPSVTPQQADQNMQQPYAPLNAGYPQPSSYGNDETHQPFFPSNSVCPEGNNQVVPQMDMNIPAHQGPLRVDKNMKFENNRHKAFRQAKMAECFAGSPPLPPELELPAILGGKLPPRNFKAPTKKRHVYTEKELKSRRKRGLADDSDSESEERRLVRLPRRSLLTITTPQMSHFVAYMRSNFDLSARQQDELSKQKRLVKNRECACRFRAKKELSLIEYRERVNELENDLESLRAENERLRQVVNEFCPGHLNSQPNSQPPLL